MSTGARIFSQNGDLSAEQVSEMLSTVTGVLPNYAFDRYTKYPSKNKNAWQEYYIHTLKESLADRDAAFMYEMENGPYLLKYRLSRWDEEHFGFKMATMSTEMHPPKPSKKVLQSMVRQSLENMRSNGVKFVCARSCGTDFELIHLLEELGFRYYENMIYPVVSCKSIRFVKSPAVRLMEEHELEKVIEIAMSNAYQGTHYHNDIRFEKKKVNAMYAKWIKSNWENGDSVVVIECDGEVAGYYGFKTDLALSDAMGYTYVRGSVLTLDSKFRGRGLGKDLFGGTVVVSKEMGADYFDSGYASNNHISAKLHAQHNFYSLFEDVRLHLWLEDV